MRPWTPNTQESQKNSEIGNEKTLSAGKKGVFLVPCRRRSSMTLITKAEEYSMSTARSELMFTRLRERNGLMKSVLEKLRKYLKCVCRKVLFFLHEGFLLFCTQVMGWREVQPSSSVPV